VGRGFDPTPIYIINIKGKFSGMELTNTRRPQGAVSDGFGGYR